MVLDDVYAELAHNHDVPLQDLDATTLGTVLALLQKSRKEREDYQEYRVKTDQKEASLRDTIRHLSAVNAAQTLRLLASLDSIDVLQQRASHSDEAAGERAALVAINQSLAQRLRDANAEIARVAADRHNLASGSLLNSPASITRIDRTLASRRTTPTDALPNQDGSDSDTPTERQATSLPIRKKGRSSSHLNVEGALDLRTRTIVHELTRELEAVRLRSEVAQQESQDHMALLEQHLANRDNELERAYSQLDDLYEAGMQPHRAPRRRVSVEADLSEIVPVLNRQVKQLQEDISALLAERSRLSDDTSGLLEVAAMDDLAGRASSKLVEQRTQLDAAQSEIAGLKEALQQTQSVAHDATAALEKEQGRRQAAEEAFFASGGSDSSRARTRSLSQPDLFSETQDKGPI